MILSALPEKPENGYKYGMSDNIGVINTMMTKRKYSL